MSDGARMKIYSVTVDDEVTTWFATKREATGFYRRHVDTGCGCGPVNAYSRAEVVDLLNQFDHESSANTEQK